MKRRVYFDKQVDSSLVLSQEIHLLRDIEKGTFKSNSGNDNIAILDKAVDGKVLGWIKPGQEVKYDQFTHKGRYVWVRQPRANGTYGFVAIGRSNGKKKTVSWGPCY